jgi:hypothetical protein
MENCPLQVLHLANCGMTSEGLASIAALLLFTDTLCELNISGNVMVDLDALNLTRCLVVHTLNTEVKLRKFSTGE